jgi:hypothetical protein
VSGATIILCAPFIQAIFSIADEGVLLHGAERILRGNILYTDFFEILPPGGFVLTAAWLKVAGISIWSARSLAILIILGISCFTYLGCRQASQNAPLSALLAIGWVLMSQGSWTQVNHHYFTTLFSMVAAWAAFCTINDTRRRSRWPIIAGTAAGTAAMMSPTRGALAILAAVVAFIRPWQQLAAYAVAGVLVPLALLIYVFWHHALAAAIYDIIVFPAIQYGPIQTIPFGTFADAQDFPLVYLLPFTAFLTLLVCLRYWRTFIYDRLLRSCVAFALASFLGCFPRPDIVHIAFTTPLALPLFALCGTRLTERWHRAFRYAAAGVLIGLFAATGIPFGLRVQEALHGDATQSPEGNLRLVDQPALPEMLTRLSALPATDGYFFYPYMPMLPFLSAREHISRYDIFIPGYTLPSQYQDACISVMRHASWLVIDRKRTDPKFLKRLYPAMPDTPPREMREFERILDSNFELVAQDGTFELRRRQEGVSDTVCARVAE